MPSVPQVIAARRRHDIHTRGCPFERLSLGCVLAFNLLLALSALGITAAYIALFSGLPALDALPALLSPPGGLLLQPTEFYDRSGEELLFTLQPAVLLEKQYLHLPAEAQNETATFAPSLVEATLAAASSSFEPDPIFRWNEFLPGRPPTLAQRLVSDLLLGQEAPGLRRDLRVRLLAQQISAHYGSDQVLEWHLNSAHYGNMAYGADAAARLYLGKPASRLSLGEAALLAAVAQAPALNPWDDLQAALAGRRLVLQAMLDQGRITPNQARQAGQEKPAVTTRDRDQPHSYPGFTELAVSQLSTQIPLQRLERGGLRIRTTLDAGLQARISCTLAQQFGGAGSAAPESGNTPAEDCAAPLPLLPLEGFETANLAAAAAVLDPIQGEILALAGSPPEEAAAPHTPGTLLTPFVYLTAFTRGMSPASLVWDIPPDPEQPTLPGRSTAYHGPVRLRTALANDYFTPALQVLQNADPRNVWRTAQQFGLVSLAVPGAGEDWSIFEGKGTTLLEFSQAFGALANDGVMTGWAGDLLPNPHAIQPRAVLGVQDPGGVFTRDWGQAASTPVVSAQLAYLLNHILSDEAARWPSLGHPNLLETGRPAAAKIGRTLDGSEAWTAGYTPQRVVSVWTGPRDESAPAGEVLEQVSAALWQAVIQEASRDMPALSWEAPPGVSRLTVCDPSGLLPTPDCPATVTEVFLQSNAPNHPDDLYRRLKVNRQTGRLATLFTPFELIEERVYLSVPPEAVPWARSAGVPVPPTSYDVIQISGGGAADQQPEDARLDSPTQFAFVRGNVRIEGRAAGDDFTSYRVLAGQGLNPEVWFQVGTDSARPVSHGKLAEWDTTGLSGLYVLQLEVVSSDQRLETGTVLVAVDNQKPELEVIYPQAGRQVTPNSMGAVTIQVSAQDDLALQEVAFYVDNRKVIALTGPPYAFPWNAITGQHVLRVEATDQAGNRAQTSVEFEVK